MNQGFSASSQVGQSSSSQTVDCPDNSFFNGY